MKKKSYGIIGNPIKHSLSPTLHNYWFKKYKIDADYKLFEIKNEKEDLEKIINLIKNKELDGINVTLPYKQIIIPFVDRLVNDALSTGSVNTIFLDDQGALVGENTDVYGLQAAYLKEVSNAEYKNALVIGAGGVSPSVIFALKKSKIKNIFLINRTYEKSIFLKKKFDFLNILKWNSLEKELNKFDLIINATSLGLKNGPDFECSFANVKSDLVYIDTVYNPLETKILKYLKENKKKTFNGLEMFVYQGQKSFYLWNKKNPEIDNDLINLLTSKLQ